LFLFIVKLKLFNEVAFTAKHKQHLQDGWLVCVNYQNTTFANKEKTFFKSICAVP
jgi:hypothetical protein